MQTRNEESKDYLAAWEETPGATPALDTTQDEFTRLGDRLSEGEQVAQLGGDGVMTTQARLRYKEATGQDIHGEPATEKAITPAP